MSRQLQEIELVLQSLVTEHRKLLSHVEQHAAAMRALDLKAMEQASRQQESARLRIAALEKHRQGLALQLARAIRSNEKLTVTRLAELFPQRASELTKRRDELREVIQKIQSRTHVAGRLAGAVLGHLNTAVRIIAGAVEQAGVYTKTGSPKLSPRIGVIEAVG